MISVALDSIQGRRRRFENGEVAQICLSKAWERWKPTRKGIAFKQGNLIVENDFEGNTAVICNIPCDWFEIARWGVIVQIETRIGNLLFYVQKKNGLFQKKKILGAEYGKWSNWDVSSLPQTAVVRHGNDFAFFGADEKICKIGTFVFSGPFFGHKKGFVYREKGRIFYVRRNGEKEALEEEIPDDWKAGFDRIYYRRGNDFFSIETNGRVEKGRFVSTFRADEWRPHSLGIIARKGEDKFFLLASPA